MKIPLISHASRSARLQISGEDMPIQPISGSTVVGADPTQEIAEATRRHGAAAGWEARATDHAQDQRAEHVVRHPAALLRRIHDRSPITGPARWSSTNESERP